MSSVSQDSTLVLPLARRTPAHTQSEAHAPCDTGGSPQSRSPQCCARRAASASTGARRLLKRTSAAVGVPAGHVRYARRHVLLDELQLRLQVLHGVARVPLRRAARQPSKARPRAEARRSRRAAPSRCCCAQAGRLRVSRRGARTHRQSRRLVLNDGGPANLAYALQRLWNVGHHGSLAGLHGVGRRARLGEVTWHRKADENPCDA